jgi:thymidylate synthase (FAD)
MLMEDIMGGPKIRLISYTQPVDEIKNQGISDALELVAFCARVSNPSNQYNSETAEKLVRYLVKHKHWSPLEMVDATLEIETTRDITHQIIRHRSFSFQEFSQRYADPTKDMQFVTREARLQDNKNRQNSVDVDDVHLQNEWYRAQQRALFAAEREYKWAIDNGIAKEQARAVLPEGLTTSRIYMKGSIRSWLHYIEVRTDPSTQKEHREVALECAKEIAKIFPNIVNI